MVEIFADCLMIGDDAEADVAAAIHAGLHGCQVRTGKYTSGDEEKLPPETSIIDSIADIYP
jgi:ribonucleotide monophosphatase NagD (HAD superfamily)